MGNCFSSASNETLPNQNLNGEETSNMINVASNQDQAQIQTNSYLEQAKLDFDSKYAEPSAKTAKLEDFQLQRTIGKGSFARIMLVKHGNQSLALKIMEKKSIVELNQDRHILSEKRILQATNSPFIVNLIYAFKDNACLYLALEFVSGGDMYGHLREVTIYTECQARFYAAQIVLALEYLHYLNIIYRNLKPEDILFAADGYLKLTDFGFAKVIKDKTDTLCGTPEYLAPEVIVGREHGKGVDYWALGVLLYEMTTGSSPFRSEDPMETYKKIISSEFVIPPHLSSNVADLIKKFLEINPTERYGCLENGIQDIKGHKWFSSIDWIAIGEKRIKAPFLPKDGKDYYEQFDEKSFVTADTVLYFDEFADF